MSKKYNITHVEITTDYKEGDIDVGWIGEGIGFGHLSFERKDNRIICHNETMSKNFIKAVLLKLVDVSILDS